MRTPLDNGTLVGSNNRQYVVHRLSVRMVGVLNHLSSVKDRGVPHYPVLILPSYYVQKKVYGTKLLRNKTPFSF